MQGIKIYDPHKFRVTSFADLDTHKESWLESLEVAGARGAQSCDAAETLPDSGPPGALEIKDAV